MIRCGFCFGHSLIECGKKIGIIFGKAIEAIARQPEAQSLVQPLMFLGFALVFLTLLSSYAIAVAIALLVLDPWLALLALGLTIPFFVTAMRFNRRMENVWASNFSGSGLDFTQSKWTCGSTRWMTRSVSRKLRDLKYSPWRPRCSPSLPAVRKLPIRSATAFRYCRTVRRESSIRAGLFRACASGE